MRPYRGQRFNGFFAGAGEAMRTRILFDTAAFLVFSAFITGCAQDAPADGRVSLALDASVCADFCTQAVGAAVYRAGETIPIGPEQIVACGDPLVFDHIPAGHRVQVQARALGLGGVVLLEGRSAEVIPVADDEVAVPIDLQPVVRPVIGAATPSVVAPVESGVEVILSGTSFGEGDGLASVEIDGVPVEVVAGSWNDASVHVVLMPGTGGSVVRVRNCGVASEAFAIRIFADPPGLESLQPQGCPGGVSIRSIVPLGGTSDLLLASACQSSGYIQRFLTGECAVSAVLQKPLPGLPVAMTTDPDGLSAWVILEPPGGLIKVPLAADLPVEPGPSMPDGAVPQALVWSGDSLWMLCDLAEGRRLFRVRDGAATRFEDVPADLALHDIASAAGVVLIAAANATGEGRLVVVNPVTSEVRRITLPGCEEPAGVVGGDDGRFAIVGCGGTAPSLAVVRLADGFVAAVPSPDVGRLTSLAIDLAGSVAFGWDAASGKLVGIELSGGTVLKTWLLGTSAEGMSMVRLPSADTLAMAGPDAGRITLFAPYRGLSPCAIGGP